MVTYRHAHSRPLQGPYKHAAEHPDTLPAMHETSNDESAALNDAQHYHR